MIRIDSSSSNDKNTNLLLTTVWSEGRFATHFKDGAENDKCTCVTLYIYI
jgi:hypothetical protein